MPSTAPLVLDRKEAIKMSPAAPTVHVSVDERIKVCKQVPQQDWEEYAGLKHVAISATRGRILDGDNDEVALSERVSAAYPADRIFHAPGRKKPAPSRSRA